MRVRGQRWRSRERIGRTSSVFATTDICVSDNERPTGEKPPLPGPDKPLVWLAGEIKTPPFSPQARIETGVLLRRLQRGEKLVMPGFRPMPSIGTRCGEL